jgi:hypothetical protein
MRHTGLLTVVLLSAPACTSREDPARSVPAATTVAASDAPKTAAPIEAKVTPASEVPKAAPAQPEPAVEPSPAAKPDLPAAVEPAAVEPAAVEPAAVEPAEVATVPVQAITPTAVTVAWREVARPSEAVKFEPLIRGVLGKSASGYHDVDDSGALVLRPEIEAPASPVLGVWPDNAWVIETRTKVLPGDRSGFELRQIRLLRLRGKRRWVPQMYNGEQRFEDEGQRFQVGGAGGLIVEFEGALTRLADNAVDPVLGLDVGGELVGYFESKSGAVYPIRCKDEALFVQRDCADLECVTLHAIRLPFGTQWSFTSPVTRQKHSVSGVAEVRRGEDVQPYLLHYEADGWKLESLTGAPTGLWPTKDGGLWTMIGARLLHRDPQGAWREVAVPEGATAVSVAMRADFSELWIAATVGDAAVVFATAASAQSSAVAPGTP